MNYKAFKVAVVDDVIGWKSSAGYLEGRITKIDTRKNTACKKTLSDWVLVELEPYFARYEGETAYLNAGFLMSQAKVRNVMGEQQ